MLRYALLYAGLLSTGGLAAQDVGFRSDVLPILSANCYPCHGPDAGRRKAKLRLDRVEGATAPCKHGAAVVPGDPEHSALVRRIRAADPDDRMPPPESHKKLTTEQIATLERWIAQGAVYQKHWAYVPPVSHPLPDVRDAGWCRGFIDRFVLRGVQDHGLEPSPEADRATLARRLSFDLLGLPPSPEQVAEFRADRRPGAYGRLVDRLLASPHYGERMATYWLDLVRYADTVGYHGDQEHPISPYRDWVIAAWNDDMPFDRFTIEQLAGDLLDHPTVAQRVATGYNRVLQTTHEGGAQAKEYLAIYAADRVRNVSAVWLASTLGCAQCHDHKYDPFTQKEFYEMAAFFADIEEKGDFAGSPNTSPTTRPPEMVVWSEEKRAEVERVDAELATLALELSAGEQKDLLERRDALRRRRAELERQGRRTMITVATEPRITRVLARGNWMDESGEVVQPNTPYCLPPLPASTWRRRATRLDLARWLVSADNPLTARVFVNRLWYLFFGEGLSTSLDDFGSQGAGPSHPELLDELALEFVRSGWDVKHMVRLLVTSSAYRQSSRGGAAAAAADPGNRWFGRQRRWRLPAEMIRDNALAISGLLVDDVIGGPSIRPYQPAGYYQHLNFPKRKYRADTDERQWRRGVYMHWQRQFLHPALRAFDAPTREECTARRPISNTPQAALTLLDDPTFVEAARAFAVRLLRQASSDEARLALGFQRALARPPSAGERAILLDLLARHRADLRDEPEAAARLNAVGLDRGGADFDPRELAAWTSVTRVLLNLDETITRS